jgi:uncharacterized phage protein gp47/JayE
MTIPTIEQLRNQVLTDIQTGLGLSTPLPSRSVWGILATAIAGVLHLVYRFGLWAYNQIFTSTADEQALLLRASEYGLTRTPAQSFRGTITATGVNDTQIPSGSLFQANGVVYATQSLQQISGGTATLTIESLEPSRLSNREIGDILTLVNPIAGIDNQATTASIIQTGEDSEPIEDFRLRLANRQAFQPQGGAIPDYVLWATEVPGISEAYPNQPTPGVVNVYPIATGTVRIPTSGKLTEVTDYLNEDIRRPLGPVTIQALAFTDVEFDVDISGLQPNNAQTQSDIEQALETYFLSRRPQIYTDEVNPRNVISQSDVTREASQAGAQIATVVLKNAGGTPISSYTLDPNELSILRTLTWL